MQAEILNVISRANSYYASCILAHVTIKATWNDHHDLLQAANNIATSSNYTANLVLEYQLSTYLYSMAWFLSHSGTSSK
jgi:hypothetical protein